MKAGTYVNSARPLFIVYLYSHGIGLGNEIDAPFLEKGQQVRFRSHAPAGARTGDDQIRCGVDERQDIIHSQRVAALPPPTVFDASIGKIIRSEEKVRPSMVMTPNAEDSIMVPP
jgi:hypothetical protein